MNKKVFVTGVGAVGPCGNTAKTFWNGLLSRKNFISKLSSNGERTISPYIGGIVENINPENYFSTRFLNKCSRFSILSLIASREAILDAGINMDESNKEKIGVFVGNNSGGWESAREGLKMIHKESSRLVSPYLASNWFPAAAQGHISIAFGIKGYSKTVIADRVSSLLAISYAAKAIRMGKIDIAIVGGVETPLDDWALTFYNTTGILNKSTKSPENAYKPFDKERKGMVLAEGAAYLVLESEESVKRRNAQSKIKANIQGFSMTHSGTKDQQAKSIEQCSASIRMAIENSDISIDDIKLVSLDGVATESDDIVEARALNQVFKNKVQDKYFICPKASFGNTIGASGAFDVVLAIQSMNNSILPCMANLENEDTECNLNFVSQKNISVPTNSALIMSRGLGGISSGLVINNKNY